GPARRRSGPLAGRPDLHRLGLPGRDVPPGHGDADRPGAGHRAGGRPGAGGLDRPAGPQGQRAERPRAGDRGPGRSAGRRHRAGRAAALRAGHRPTREEAAPGALITFPDVAHWRRYAEVQAAVPARELGRSMTRADEQVRAAVEASFLVELPAPALDWLLSGATRVDVT